MKAKHKVLLSVGLIIVLLLNFLRTVFNRKSKPIDKKDEIKKNLKIIEESKKAIDDLNKKIKDNTSDELDDDLERVRDAYRKQILTAVNQLRASGVDYRIPIEHNHIV